MILIVGVSAFCLGFGGIFSAWLIREQRQQIAALRLQIELLERPERFQHSTPRSTYWGRYLIADPLPSRKIP